MPRALLIGVGKRESDSPAMAISAEDAIYLKKALKAFDLFQEEQITTLTNEQASRAGILGSLNKIAQETEQEECELVLLYFSGHGSKRGDKYHLICRDTSGADLEATAISGNAFLSALNAIKTNKMLVLLDCCHSEGLGDNTGNEIIPFDGSEFLRHDNRVIITACSKDQVSYLSKPLSVFTYALIEGLGGKFLRSEDREVNIFNLAMDVRERVFTLSQQVAGAQQPQLNILQGANTSNFVLAKYATGGNSEIALLKEKPLQSFDGTKTFELDVPNIRDDQHRNLFSWFTIQNFFNNVGTVNQVIVQTINNNMTIKVDNHVLELKNDFKNFQELVKRQLERITIKDAISGREYDGQDIREHEFELYTGTREINQELTQTLMRRFALTDEKAQAFLNGTVGGDAKTYIVAKYGGVLKVQVRKLMSVGREPLHKFDVDEYIVRSIATAKIAIQVLTYSMMSALWGLKKTGGAVMINADEKNMIRLFFSVNRNPDIDWELNLLSQLYTIFKRNNLQLPIPEISSLEPLLVNGQLLNDCRNLQSFQQLLARKQCRLNDCVRAEKFLCRIMEATDFLVHYKMISVKDIFYEKHPFDPPKYFTNHTEVGKELSERSAETFNDTTDPMWTDSVLLFKTEFRDYSVNLFPFAIDLNALSRDSSGARIYLYVSDDTLNSVIKYYFTEDDTEKDIYDEALPNQQEFIGALKWEAIKKLKMKGIYNKLQEAKATILN